MPNAARSPSLFDGMRFQFLAAACLLAACKAKSTDQVSASEPPQSTVAPSIEEYERLLAQNEAALRDEGLEIPLPTDQVVLSKKADGSRDHRGGPEEAEAEAGGTTASPTGADATDEEKTEDQAPGLAERCERICDLASVTCDLATKICDLAEDHAGDPRYENACARAGVDCDIAGQACRACAG